jgi:hypothetical protein
MSENDPDPKWQVWRQDDHGNKFLVKEGFLCRGDAQKLCDTLTARGHKQTYWVEPPESDSDSS